MIGDFDRRLAKLQDSQRRHEEEHRSGQKHKDGLLKDEGEVEAIATGRVDDRAKGSICGGGT
jgi:hypothetical protein